LIVARLSYDATEKDLESEFGRFGPIERVFSPITLLLTMRLPYKQIRIVTDTHQDEKPNKKKKKHRGYAFVVYEREKDMRGKLDQIPRITKWSPDSQKLVPFVTDMALKLACLFLYLLLPTQGILSMGK
jgi:U1 small nuclear ribonucleoprotein